MEVSVICVNSARRAARPSLSHAPRAHESWRPRALVERRPPPIDPLKQETRSAMPTTYLTPGVYVEEIPAAQKPLEGVSTSVAAFIGLAPGGPVNTPMRIANWSQFARIFGDPSNPDPGPVMQAADLAQRVYG